MSNAGSQLSFRTPDQVMPPAGALEASPVQVQQWLEGLPMANIRESTRQVYVTLQRINSYKLAPADRIRILEQFRPVVLAISASLRKHFVAQTFPLPEKNQKVVNLLQEIIAHMAVGYKSVIYDTLSNKGQRIDARALATAIHRNLRYLGLILLRAYQTYSPYPEGIWKEINQLYSFAEQNKLSTPVIKDEELDKGGSSIADLYAHILLLSLASPYRLRNGEAELVDQALDSWTEYAALSPFQLGQPSKASFAVALNQDAPPGYFELIKPTPENAKALRLLDTTALEATVEQERERAGTTKQSAFSLNGMSPNLLQRLAVAWGPMPDRTSNRLNIRSDVQVCVGLNAIHHFLTQEASRKSNIIDFNFSRKQAEQDDASVTAPSGLSLALEEFAGYRHLPLDETDLFSEQLRLASEKAGEISYGLQNWKMVNVSAGGYCLQWQGGDDTKTQVGELMGLRKPDDEEWAVGVIRWMQSEMGAGLKVGVQLLATQAAAIDARHCKNERHCDDHATHCLLIPENTATGVTASLITPSHPFHLNGLATITHNKQDYYVRLNKVLENTGNFTQFSYLEQGHVVTPLNRTFHQKQDGHNDDSVWSIL